MSNDSPPKDIENASTEEEAKNRIHETPSATQTIKIEIGSCYYNARMNFSGPNFGGPGPFLCIRSSSTANTDDSLPYRLRVVFDDSDEKPDARLYYARDLSFKDDDKAEECRDVGPLPEQSDVINILYTEERPSTIPF